MEHVLEVAVGQSDVPDVAQQDRLRRMMWTPLGEDLRRAFGCKVARLPQVRVVVDVAGVPDDVSSEVWAKAAADLAHPKIAAVSLVRTHCDGKAHDVVEVPDAAPNAG